MENRVAVISIILTDVDIAPSVNQILNDYSENIIGRMGLPYKEKNINIICIVLDAKQDVINTLSGKLGKLDGVSVKANYVIKKTDSESGV